MAQGIRRSPKRRLTGRCLRGAALGAALAVLAGCATSQLNRARSDFYDGRLDEGLAALEDAPDEKTDRVLLLMERGAIHQARGDYLESIRDWLEAAAQAEKLDYYSVSRGTASFAISDEVLAFRGAPFERVLLHAFAAKSYAALGLWEDAAVEGRRLIARLENRGAYPDDAYSRYVAAFCLQMIGDSDGAAFQYRAADGLLDSLHIDSIGHLSPTAATEEAAAPPAAGRRPGEPELVCFVLIGRAPGEGGRTPGGWRWEGSPHARISTGGRVLGRSYTLASTAALRAETEKATALRTTVKTTTRIALKEAASQLVAEENEALGDLLRLLLFSLETPDERHWSTLPQWLQVARVPCPADLSSYSVDIIDRGRTVKEGTTVSEPLVRQHNTYYSFVRIY